MSGAFVGRLSHYVTEKDIEKLFQSYGRIREVTIKVGYGFVHFEDQGDAEAAIRELDGKEFLGSRIVVEHIFGSQRKFSSWGGRFDIPLRTEYKLIVENLSSRVTWQDLKDIMRQGGHDVIFASAHKDKKNEGLIEFASYRDMKRALDRFDGTNLNGRKIRLKEYWSRSSSRSMSVSRSRSTSKRPIDLCHDDDDTRSPCKETNRSPPRQSPRQSRRRGREDSPRSCHDDTKKRKRSESVMDEGKKCKKEEEEEEGEVKSESRHGNEADAVDVVDVVDVADVDDDDKRSGSKKKKKKDGSKGRSDDKIYYLCITSRPPNSRDHSQSGIFALDHFINMLKEQTVCLEKRSSTND